MDDWMQLEDQITTGSIETSDDEVRSTTTIVWMVTKRTAYCTDPTSACFSLLRVQKRAFAAASLAANCQDKDFRSLFPHLVELHEQQEAAKAAATKATVAVTAT